MRLRPIYLCLIFLFTSIAAPSARAEGEQIRIVTRPAGATVFVDGVEKGRTPLNISAGEKPANVRLSMSGFEDLRFPLRATGDLEIVIILVPGATPGTAMQNPTPEARSKNRSPYWGAFARSLILPGWGQYSKGDSNSFWFLTGTLVSGIAYLDASQSFARVRKDAITKYQEGDAYSLLQAGTIPALRTRDTAATQAIGIALLHRPSGNENQFTKNCIFVNYVNATNGTAQTCRRNRRALERKHTTGYIFAGLYLWTAFDALLATEKASLSVGVPEAERGLVLSASLKF